MDKFPTLAFKSTSVSLVKPGELGVEGELTIRDVTRKVLFDVEGPTLPAKDPWGNTRIAVSASTKISRKDFGLTWNAALESGGCLVGDEVTITRWTCWICEGVRPLAGNRPSLVPRGGRGRLLR